MKLDPVSIGFSIFDNIRRRRKAKKAAREQRTGTELDLGLPTEEGTKMLKGKLTYSMIGALALQTIASALGLDVAPAEVDALLAAVTVVGAIYGRYRATKS